MYLQVIAETVSLVGLLIEEPATYETTWTTCWSFWIKSRPSIETVRSLPGRPRGTSRSSRLRYSVDSSRSIIFDVVICRTRSGIMDSLFLSSAVPTVRIAALTLRLSDSAASGWKSALRTVQHVDVFCSLTD